VAPSKATQGVDHDSRAPGLFNDQRVAPASTPVTHDAHDPKLSPEYRGLDCTTYVVFGEPRSLCEAAKAGPILVDVPAIACHWFDYGSQWWTTHESSPRHIARQ
jgi:hypothetical protein